MDELSPKLRSLLDAARDADDPDERDAQRVRAAIAATLAQPASSGGEPPAARNGATNAIWKWLGIGVVASGLIAAGVAMRHRAPPTARRLEAPPPASVIAPAPVAPRPPARAPEAADTESPAPAPAVSPERATPKPAAPAPARNPERKSARTQGPRHAAEPPQGPVPRENPSELALIRSATGALRDTDGRAALLLLERHAQLYPDGILEQERDGLRVLALCALGETSRALDERERFLRAAPHSPLAGRVRAACGEPEQP